MKVLILSVSDKRHMPMAAPYFEYLKSNNIAFDIIRTNRYEKRQQHFSETIDENSIYEFNMVFKDNISQYGKMLAFWRFRL